MLAICGPIKIGGRRRIRKSICSVVIHHIILGDDHSHQFRWGEIEVARVTTAVSSRVIATPPK